MDDDKLSARPKSGMSGSSPVRAIPDGIVRVKMSDTTMQMDVATLVTLIQQKTVNADTEVNSVKLTSGDWRKLGELEVFRALENTPSSDSGREKTSGNGQETEPYEQNLADYFRLLNRVDIRRDSTVGLVSAVLAALLSVMADHYLLGVVLAGIGVGLGFLAATSLFFPRWIMNVRLVGFKRLPWNSRFFLVIALVVPAYLLVASFLPEVPGQGLQRLVDGLVLILLGLVSGFLWAFRTETGRMRRAFELSKDVGLRE